MQLQSLHIWHFVRGASNNKKIWLIWSWSLPTSTKHFFSLLNIYLFTQHFKNQVQKSVSIYSVLRQIMLITGRIYYKKRKMVWCHSMWQKEQRFTRYNVKHWKRSLLLKLQTVNEHSLQLVDVLGGLYRDAEPPRWAWKPTSRAVRRFVARLSDVVAEGFPAASRRSLVLVDVRGVVLRWQAVVVLGLVRPVMAGLEVVFRPGALAGAVRRAVGHQAGLQAAVSPHGPVQVQSGDERLANVDAFGPVDRFVLHGGEGALKAHGEDQLLLLGVGYVCVCVCVCVCGGGDSVEKLNVILFFMAQNHLFKFNLTKHFPGWTCILWTRMNEWEYCARQQPIDLRLLHFELITRQNQDSSVVERAPHWHQDSRKSLHLLLETKNTSFPTRSGFKTQISTSVALKWLLLWYYWWYFCSLTFLILVFLSLYSWLMHLL